MESQTLNFNKVHFVTSAPDIRHLPNDGGVEIAFAGRSNAGKSSALNTLTKHKNLARTSKTPGRTQLINLFELEPGKRLVDLPGYGYAQVPLEMKLKWQKSLAEYLQRRESLKGLVILMDIRHPLKETDMNMLEWSAHRQLPVMLLLTKADKLSPGPRNNQVIKVRNAVVNLGPQIQVEAFSSLNNIGVDKLTQTLSAWYLANAAAGSETRRARPSRRVSKADDGNNERSTSPLIEPRSSALAVTPADLTINDPPSTVVYLT